jgi:DNA-binding beta-propeller fold protein YncE
MNYKVIGVIAICFLLVGGLLLFHFFTRPTITLQPVKDIPLTGGADRFDYQSTDAARNLLFISHLGSKSVVVFDIGKQTVVKTIQLRAEPYGILVVPALKKVFVGVGGNNTVAVIDEDSFNVLTYIPAGYTPDGLAFADYTGKIFVSNENGSSLSVINASKNTITDTINVGGNVGNTVFDPFSKLIYTVSGKDNALIEIDPIRDTVLNRYRTIGCLHPHGLSIDIQTHDAFIACQENNVLIVFNLTDKTVVATETVGNDPDVLAYDKGLHYLYVAAESGDVAVFAVKKDAITKVSQTHLADSAHTISVNAATHAIYLPLENINGKPVLRILQPIIP